MRGLTACFGAANRRVRELVFGIAAAIIGGIFAAIGFGFGTFAAYVHFETSQGRVVAALIVAATYGLLAIAVWTTLAARRRARAGRTNTVSALKSSEADSLLGSATGAANPDAQLALSAAMQLGRELSPLQLLLLAIIGGFIAGRKFGK